MRESKSLDKCDLTFQDLFYYTGSELEALLLTPVYEARDLIVPDSIHNGLGNVCDGSPQDMAT